jgi:hypothetical protein
MKQTTGQECTSGDIIPDVFLSPAGDHGNYKIFYIPVGKTRFRTTKAAFRKLETAPQKFETPFLLCHV